MKWRKQKDSGNERDQTREDEPLQNRWIDEVYYTALCRDLHIGCGECRRCIEEIPEDGAWPDDDRARLTMYLSCESKRRYAVRSELARCIQRVNKARQVNTEDMLLCADGRRYYQLEEPGTKTTILYECETGGYRAWYPGDGAAQCTNPYLMRF